LTLLPAGKSFALLPAMKKAPRSNLYVGLGDSVAAGIGLTGSTAGDVCGVTTD
jgi:hypothetical protein